jgi:hypothetical protein
LESAELRDGDFVEGLRFLFVDPNRLVHRFANSR